MLVGWLFDVPLNNQPTSIYVRVCVCNGLISWYSPYNPLTNTMGKIQVEP